MKAVEEVKGWEVRDTAVSRISMPTMVACFSVWVLREKRGRGRRWWVEMKKGKLTWCVDNVRWQDVLINITISPNHSKLICMCTCICTPRHGIWFRDGEGCDPRWTCVHPSGVSDQLLGRDEQKQHDETSPGTIQWMRYSLFFSSSYTFCLYSYY